MITSADHLRIAIGIASAGRRDVLSETVSILSRQTRQPDDFLICPAVPEDADNELILGWFPAAKIVSGPVGATAQRNTIINATQADIIIFFDDDFLPSEDYLAEAEQLFRADPSIVVLTGHVLADGIHGAGLGFAEACAILATAGENTDNRLVPTYGGYGCNMAIRLAPVRARGLKFDENLPLYSWLEDIDFSRQLAPSGQIVRSYRLRGVHMGTRRSGRSSGKRLGYSQIANPLYCIRKGTISWRYAMSQMMRNLAANTVKSLRPEPWVDRRGRLTGNLLAIRDCITGKVTPSRIKTM